VKRIVVVQAAAHRGNTSVVVPIAIAVITVTNVVTVFINMVRQREAINVTTVVTMAVAPMEVLLAKHIAVAKAIAIPINITAQAAAKESTSVTNRQVVMAQAACK